MDDAGRVNPYEHLAFPGTGLLRLVVGEGLGAIAGAQTNRLHAPLPNKHLSAERERDKPRQGVVATMLNSSCNGAVRFIDWLGVVAHSLHRKKQKRCTGRRENRIIKWCFRT